MNYSYVAIPVLKGRTTFVLDKGRSWSAIEHLLLEALTRQRWTSTDLANAGALPRRVVVEAITRLMRAGWVEVSQQDNRILFGATQRGAIAAASAELPAAAERTTKSISYVIDLIAGDVFRKRNLILQTENEISSTYGSKCIRIESVSAESTLDANEIINALLDDDETFITTERSGTRRLFLIASVRNGVIEGLPDGKEFPHLRAAVLEAANSTPPCEEALGGPKSLKLPEAWLTQFEVAQPKEFPIRFTKDDLILDGLAHRDELVRTLNYARKIVVIHSTFILASRFFELFPLIRDAVNRGVRVHILWGQNENIDEQVSTQSAVAEILDSSDVRSLGDNFRIHPFSTGSHAKLLIADAGQKGFVAIVGSCNWLTSGFTSYEVSVRLRDPEIVEEVVRKLSALAPVRNGDWTDFSSELVYLRMDVSKSPRRGTPNATASIVVGAQHNGEILRARDSAKDRVVVASHRLGAVASPSTLVPLAAAVRSTGISATVYYGRRQQPVNRSVEQEVSERAAEEGVDVKCIERPRLHAKVVAWDNDNIVVSSLNWTSADPVGFGNLKEIGVSVQATGVAQALISHLSAAIDGSG